jgi:cytochrome c-type biogenesis protein CcmF
VHPVLLYLGYVGLAVPFAVAMATILTRAPGATTLPLIRRWALVPWAFLSLGIVAGMWWSYAVLGWGGYWSWDPVENASLMPWLITTAFLHSLQVQERRRMLQVWTLSLIVGAFQLSILGTFLTRSGVLASVHSFTQSGIGPLFLGFLVVSLTASLGLVLARSRELSATGRLDALICRESVFLFNNLLLVAVTFTVLFGTLFPLLAEAVQGAQLSVGAPYFDRIVVPLGVGLLLLMGIGPALPWGAARLEELQWRLLVPVACGVALVVLLVLIGVRGPGTLNVFGVIAFVAAVTIARVRGDMQARRRSTGETWMEGTGHLLRANPRRYAGYLVHLGVLLLVAGIAASQAYQVRGYVTLHYGQAATVDGYRLVDSGLRPRKEPNRMVMGAAVAATRGGESLGILVPSQNFYATMQQPIVTPGVREEPSDILIGLLTGRSPLPDLAQLTQGRNPFEDLYLVLESVNGVNANHFNARAGSITLLVLVNPMVGFIWLGGFTMGLGGFLAVLPARKRRRVVVTAPVRVEPEGVEVPA